MRQQKYESQEFNDIFNILKELNISTVISIDDDWNLSREEEIMEVEVNDFCTRYGIDLTKELEDFLFFKGIKTLRQLISAIYTIDASEEELTEAVEEIQTALKNIIDQKIPGNLASLETILNFMPDHLIEVKTYGAFKEVDFSMLNERTLFIIDRNMSKSGEKEDSVYDYVKEITRRRESTKLDIVIIYSSENHTEYSDYDKKVNYLKEKLKEDEVPAEQIESIADLMAYQLWAIDKTSEVRGLKGLLLEAIKNTFIGFSLYHYLKSQLQIHEQSIRYFIKKADSSISHLSLGALIEGESFVEALNRAKEFHIHQKTFENKENLMILKNILTAEAHIAKAHRKKGKLEEIRVKRILEMVNDENYLNDAKHGIIDFSVNTLYKDVSTGDIFLFEYIENDMSRGLQYGLLVTPECDCVIRGNPAERNEKNFQILLLKTEPLENYKEEKEAKKLSQSNPSLWPFYFEGNYFNLKSLRQLLTIDGFILDLCTLNKEGKAYLDFNLEESESFKTIYSNEYFSESMEKRKIDLENYVNVLVGKMMKITKESLKHTEAEAIQEQQRISGNLYNTYFEETVILKFNIGFDQQNKRAFKMQRIGRLESRRTLQLIQNSFHHFSRAGAHPNSTVQ